LGERLVVDGKTIGNNRHSVAVLASFPQCASHGSGGVAWISGGAGNCSGPSGVAPGRAVALGCHSSKRLLCAEQRCAVSGLLWRAVSLRAAMARAGAASRVTWRVNRSGNGSRVPDETVECSHDYRGGGRARSAAFADVSAKTGRGICSAGRDPFPWRHPHWHLDGVAGAPLWGCNRVCRENCLPRLDAQAPRQLVVPSHLYAARALDFLVGFVGEFLARRSRVASSTVGLAGRGWFLCHLI